MAKSKAKSKTKTKPAAKAKPKAAAKIAVKAAAKPAAKAVTRSTPARTAVKAKTGAVVFNPLDDRILVEPLAESDRTPGGLYIPDTATEKPTKGRVVAVGRGHRDAKGRTRPLDVKVGDQVLFTKWAGSEVSLNGTTYSIMRESDLLGVVAD